jgi:nucleotide-binding universal stress UspA family protein
VHAFDEPVIDAEQVMEAIRAGTSDARDVETRLVEGSPAERLLEVVREEDADFLVVGSRGRGAIAGGLLGSVARDLTQTATCPLVVVPPNASSPADGEGTVVCGVDGSQHALAAARVARQLGERLGYGVAVVHASRTARSLLTYVGRSTTPSVSVQPDIADKQSQEILRAATDALGVEPAFADVEAGDAADVLLSVAKRENGRMIVIAARGVGAVHAALLGSVAVSLLQAAEVPVVVLSEPAERASASP